MLSDSEVVSAAMSITVFWTDIKKKVQGSRGIAHPEAKGQRLRPVEHEKHTHGIIQSRSPHQPPVMQLLGIGDFDGDCCQRLACRADPLAYYQPLVRRTPGALEQKRAQTSTSVAILEILAFGVPCLRGLCSRFYKLP